MLGNAAYCFDAESLQDLANNKETDKWIVEHSYSARKKQMQNADFLDLTVEADTKAWSQQPRGKVKVCRIQATTSCSVARLLRCVDTFAAFVAPAKVATRKLQLLSPKAKLGTVFEKKGESIYLHGEDIAWKVTAGTPLKRELNESENCELFPELVVQNSRVFDTLAECLYREFSKKYILQPDSPTSKRYQAIFRMFQASSRSPEKRSRPTLTYKSVFEDDSPALGRVYDRIREYTGKQFKSERARLEILSKNKTKTVKCDGSNWKGETILGSRITPACLEIAGQPVGDAYQIHCIVNGDGKADFYWGFIDVIVFDNSLWWSRATKYYADNPKITFEGGMNDIRIRTG